VEQSTESTEFDISKYIHLVYTKRVLFALIVMVVTTVLVIMAYLQPKRYEAKSIIFVERSLINDMVKNVTISPSFEDRTKAISIVIKSRNFLMKVLSDLDMDVRKKSPEELDSLISGFQNATDIRVDRSAGNQQDMDVFIVSYIGQDPNLASVYVNTLVRRYITDNLSMKLVEAHGANRFLYEQIDLFKKKIAKTDTEIVNMSKDKKVLQEDRLASLQKRLSELELQYTDNHPEVVKLRADIEMLQDQLKSQKNTKGSSGSARSANTNNTQDSSDGAFSAIGPSSGNKSLMDLQHERDMNKRIYEELLVTLGKSEFSTRVDVHDKAGTFKIVEPAVVPTKPISRNVFKMILIGIVGGIAAGFGVIIGLDFLDSSMRTVESVKNLGYPVLAVIPTIKTAQEETRLRRKDLLLYTTVGVYITGLLAVILIEMLGLPYVDKMMHKSQQKSQQNSQSSQKRT